jgi:N utilization substance protein A
MAPRDPQRIDHTLAAMLRQVEGVEEEPEPEVAASVDYETHLPLEEVPGVGDKMRERLLEYGITHAAVLAAADPEKLIEIPGVGPHSAAKLIEAAKAALAAQSVASQEE